MAAALALVHLTPIAACTARAWIWFAYVTPAGVVGFAPGRSTAPVCQLRPTDSSEAARHPECCCTANAASFPVPPATPFKGHNRAALPVFCLVRRRVSRSHAQGLLHR